MNSMPMQDQKFGAPCNKQEFWDNNRKLSEGSTVATTPPSSPVHGASPAPMKIPCEPGVSVGYRAELWSEEYNTSPAQPSSKSGYFGYRAELWSEEYDTPSPTHGASSTKTSSNSGGFVGYRAELWSDEYA